MRKLGKKVSSVNHSPFLFFVADSFFLCGYLLDFFLFLILLWITHFSKNIFNYGYEPAFVLDGLYQSFEKILNWAL